MGSALGKYTVDSNCSPKTLVFEASVPVVCFRLLSRVLKELLLAFCILVAFRERLW